MPNDTFVIPDVHGEFGALKKLLQIEGIVDEGTPPLRARDDVFVIQLGDLANCVDDSEADDMKCLNVVGDWIDLLVCGNHEYPYLGGPTFSGFKFKWSVFHKLANIARIGKMTCSMAVGGWLITHAGLSRMHNQSWETASHADDKLYSMWGHDPVDQIFSDIGPRRGGRSPEGGIMWHDVTEPTYSGFPQLFGHTVGRDIVWGPTGNWCCLDVGMGKHSDRLVGAWIKNGELEISSHER